MNKKIYICSIIIIIILSIFSISCILLKNNQEEKKIIESSIIKEQVIEKIQIDKLENIDEKVLASIIKNKKCIKLYKADNDCVTFFCDITKKGNGFMIFRYDKYINIRLCSTNYNFYTSDNILYDILNKIIDENIAQLKAEELQKIKDAIE